LEEARAIELDDHLAVGGASPPGRLDLTSPRRAGTRPEDLVDYIRSTATADVTHVVVAGRLVVEKRCHLALDDLGQALTNAIGTLYQAGSAAPAAN
jgi:hypothetical protein